MFRLKCLVQRKKQEKNHFLYTRKWTFKKKYGIVNPYDVNNLVSVQDKKVQGAEKMHRTVSDFTQYVSKSRLALKK